MAEDNRGPEIGTDPPPFRESRLSSATVVANAAFVRSPEMGRKA
jgi:hypothetical protein